MCLCTRVVCTAVTVSQIIIYLYESTTVCARYKYTNVHANSTTTMCRGGDQQTTDFKRLTKCAVSHLHCRDGIKKRVIGTPVNYYYIGIASDVVTMVHVLTQPHSSGEDVTVISESEAWWKYGHLLHVVYIVVVIVVRVLRVYYYSLPRNGFIKTGNYYNIIYTCRYLYKYITLWNICVFPT